MTRLAVWLLLIAWLSVTPLCAEEPEVEAHPTLPGIGFVKGVNVRNGDIDIVYHAIKMLPCKESREVRIDGKLVVKMATNLRPVYEERELRVNLRNVELLTAAGKAVKKDDVLGRLKRGESLFFFHGDRFDVYYQKLFSDDALILLITGPAIAESDL